MKKTLKTMLIATICCLSILALVSCGGGIKGDEAKVLINDFFAAVVEEDYEKAETFLHPERPGDLEEFFLNIEDKENVHFEAGITVEKYTGFSASYYDSTVGGSTYELTMRAKVGEQAVQFIIEIVKNEAGYGIYNLNVDVDT